MSPPPTPTSLSFDYSPSRTYTELTSLHLPGWSVMGTDSQTRGVTVPNLDDTLLCSACGALGMAALQNRQAREGLANIFSDTLQPGGWDTIYALLRLAGPTLAWSDIPAVQRNVVTGGPASAGKVDSAGNVSGIAPVDLMAGLGLPSPAIKLGKRFAFVSSPDVHFYLYVDKDALTRDLTQLATGGGVQFGGKTSDGTELKLRLGVGRDDAGGTAGFITLRIGPDIAPITPGR
jgi:hypothetical protein